MYHLHPQQMWELMRTRQEEMLKEAQKNHQARLAHQSHSGWLKNLFNHQRQASTFGINPSATPELG